MADMDERTALYRLYDDEGRLLYVGITRDPEKRFAQHAATKYWWKWVKRRRVEWFDRRSSARAAEEMAIKVGNPDYNIEHARARAVAPLSVSMNVAEMEGLEMLMRLVHRPGTREVSPAFVLGSLLTRELNARGLFGKEHCYHSYLGWPDGLTLEGVSDGVCPCGRLIQPDGRLLPAEPEGEPPTPGEQAA
jgi:predicted GIY-YIG superfamily endonuclease